MPSFPWISFALSVVFVFSLIALLYVGTAKECKDKAVNRKNADDSNVLRKILFQPRMVPRTQANIDIVRSSKFVCTRHDSFAMVTLQTPSGGSVEVRMIDQPTALADEADRTIQWGVQQLQHWLNMPDSEFDGAVIWEHDNKELK